MCSVLKRCTLGLGFISLKMTEASPPTLSPAATTTTAPTTTTPTTTTAVEIKFYCRLVDACALPTYLPIYGIFVYTF